MEPTFTAITPKGNFEKDVLPALQNDVMQSICEVAWNDSQDENITIVERVNRNALNIEFSGFIMIEGVEHAFHMRDGNNSGTEIISWNEDTQIEKHAESAYVLVPHGDMISAAPAMVVLKQWQEDLDPNTTRGAFISKIISDYTYDAFFAPGINSAASMRHLASKNGYIIADQEESTMVKKRLLVAALNVQPIGDWRQQDTHAVLQTYADWAQAKTQGHPINDVIVRTADHLSKLSGLTPGAEDARAMRALGFNFTEVNLKVSAWKRGLYALIHVMPIEGFDPKTLPESPIKSMLQRLDLTLVSDISVNPKIEVVCYLNALTSRMAREERFKIHAYEYDRFATIGYRLEGPEIESESDLECLDASP